MFINYTNHPSASWGEKQMDEAKKYGEIVDMPFPNISPQMTVQELTELVKTESKKNETTEENNVEQTENSEANVEENSTDTNNKIEE